jgi:hypothetical protein
MALTAQTVTDIARRVKAARDHTKDLRAEILRLCEESTNLGIAWSATPRPEYIPESADGNLDGLTFTRSDVDQALSVLNAVRTAIETGGTFVPALDKLA